MKNIILTNGGELKVQWLDNIVIIRDYQRIKNWLIIKWLEWWNCVKQYWVKYLEWLIGQVKWRTFKLNKI